jgi:hypothetical protein
MRRFSMLLISALALVASGCLGDSGSDVRISQNDLIRQVSAANYGVKTACSRKSEDGSRWVCVVGDGMDPECKVVDVDSDGSWKTEDRPPVCQYP